MQEQASNVDGNFSGPVSEGYFSASTKAFSKMNDALHADELSEVTSTKKVRDKHVPGRRKLARPQGVYMPNENLGLPFIQLNGSCNSKVVAAVKALEQRAIGAV